MPSATELVRPIIFISYSHDSDEHREAVLSLSERLRKDGFDTRLDQYVNGTPPEMWPRWMLDRLDEASHVLVICTETYYRRFRGHEEPGKGKGKGVDWEGALITQEIYDAHSQTVKFVPVLLANGLAIDEQSYGAEHPDVAIYLNNLAWLLQDPNRLAEAEPLMRRALDIFRSTLGNEHPNTLTVGRNYDHLLAAMK